jgi:hypothetical protein
LIQNSKVFLLLGVLCGEQLLLNLVWCILCSGICCHVKILNYVLASLLRHQLIAMALHVHVES